MNTRHTLRTAIGGLTAHKSRSALTTLGIVIGVAAIIIVMALGNGAQALILNTISALGAETAIIQPGTEEDNFSGIMPDSLTERDLEAITKKSNVPDLAEASPQLYVTGQAQYRDESYKATIIGGTADYFISAYELYPEHGVPFTEEDVDGRARVALVGVTVEDELFGPEGDALGKTITIEDQKFEIIGVFPKKGSLGFFNVDETVLLPYTTAGTYVRGTDYFDAVLLRAASTEVVDRMVFDITATLRDTHGIDPGEEDDFNVQTQAGLVEQVSLIVGILTAFLAAVVAISLVVGGVGIMNIMLVSVTERTKEIGLRKALGAKSSDILRQFLFEAVMLTGAGGVIGILIGSLIAFGVSFVLAQTVAEGWVFVFPIGAAVLGVVVSAGVGLVFGIYPAMQAAKKSPMEALRYE
ncbi:MAG TPA: ABC transporter permease [Candidatus Paceibacterota bacterium]|jgi:putative ABC transport system permease protein